MVSVLFVCLGNICRSPAAEEVLRKMNDESKMPMKLHVESCGIGCWHVGLLPHESMREAALERGLTLVTRAQQFKTSFFDQFDYILAADHSILNELYKLALTPEHKVKVHMISEYSQSYPREEIPDPFYEGKEGFDKVLDMLEDSCEGILNHISKKGEGSN
jgi:protein-tyrosine phosphatase